MAGGSSRPHSPLSSSRRVDSLGWSSSPTNTITASASDDSPNAHASEVFDSMIVSMIPITPEAMNATVRFWKRPITAPTSANTSSDGPSVVGSGSGSVG